MLFSYFQQMSPTQKWSLTFLLIFPMNAVLACTVPFGIQTLSITDKSFESNYIFEGTVNSISDSVATVQILQYFKGKGPDSLHIRSFNSTSCDQFLEIGQKAIFFADGNPADMLNAVYGPFKSIESVTDEIKDQIAQSTDCTATFENGHVVIPCVLHKSSGRIFQAEMQQNSSDSELFTLSKAQLGSKAFPLVTVESFQINLINIETNLISDLNTNDITPIKLSITVQGVFNDGCGQIEDIYISQQDGNYKVLITEKKEGETCTQAIVPFEENINLGTYSFPSGRYSVMVNGVEDHFDIN